MEWIVVTVENIDEVKLYLEDNNFDVVIFGLTDEGYESLSKNTSDIMQLVQQQQAIIAAYKKYYENVNNSIDKTNQSIKSDQENINNLQDNRSWWDEVIQRQ